MGSPNVHFGHRNQNAPSNKSHRGRAQPRPAPHPDSGRSAAPMSAARLAAEAAFAGPRLALAPPPPAQVVVRRARLAADAVEPVAKQPGDIGNSPAPDPVGKGPRVFRIQAAQGMTAQDAAATNAHQARVQRSSMPADGPAAGVGPRSRRIGSDKRPGPVLHKVHTLPVLQRPDEGSATELDRLRARLAAVGQLLSTIGAAPSFQAVDEHFALEWQRLSLKADDIQRDLLALRR